jgi:hypothetical protein
MAGLAFVFHFSPEVIDRLGLLDFLGWREQAIVWLKARAQAT